MKQGVILVVVAFALGALVAIVQSASAADVPVSRGDIDRIVRALENQTNAIREAGRNCR